MICSAEAPRARRRSRLEAALTGGAFVLTLLSSASVAQDVPDATPPGVEARATSHLFPRLALQLQLCCRNPTTQSLFARAARWDLVIVDSETVRTMAEYLGPTGRIRSANPNGIVVAYFSSADYIEDLDLPIYSRFRSGIEESWLLRDVEGRSVPLFELTPGRWTRALNITTPVQRFIPEFLNEHVLGSGLLDGIFYDWASVSIAWLNNRRNVPAGPIDLNGDGIAEPDVVLDESWRRGYAAMLAHSRRMFPKSTLIIGNAGWNSGPDYAGFLNGIMMEQFLEGEASSPRYGWTQVMRTYAHYATRAVAPRLSIVMANRDNPADTAFMRFALASTLMFEGYFAFTNRSIPTEAYQTARWYDEYAVDRTTGEATDDPLRKGYLGRPVTEASMAGAGVLLANVLARGLAADNEVWQRDFEYGRVLVNPSRTQREVDLGQDFRKIRGSSDRTVNDGSVVRKLALAPRTGIILLRIDCEGEDGQGGGCKPAPKRNP